MSDLLLLFIILVEGFVTVSAEILTIRQLLPVTGNSVIVTSLIIGVFLLFLAYGYRKGGQYENNYIEILKRNFTKASLWLGIGLSYFFIWFFFHFLRRNVTTDILIILSIYLFLITAPLVYILGQTVPITMNLIKKEHRAGAIGGRILHLSTIGSFLGAVATSLLLMNFLGVAWTVVINFLFLAILVWVLSTPTQTDLIRGIFLLSCLGFIYYLNIHVGHKVMLLSNSYANYDVVSDARGKILVVNESPSSLIGPQKQGFPYIELMKKILFTDLNLTNKEILVLGAGGFSLTAAGTNANHFTYVDIDKDIKKVVEQNMDVKIEGDFIVDDARVFLNNTNQKFDVIVSDVYSSFRAIPAHLLTREYFEKMYDRINPNGLALINIINNPSLQDDYSLSIDNTIRSVFKRCMSIPVKYSVQGGNVVYVCYKKDPPNLTSSIYTDDLNRATLDFFGSIFKYAPS